MDHQSLEHGKSLIDCKEIYHGIEVIFLQKQKTPGLKEWSHQDSASFTRDWLPDLDVGAKVFTFGYPSTSKLRLTKSRLDEDDFARRLLNELLIQRHNTAVSYKKLYSEIFN